MISIRLCIVLFASCCFAQQFPPPGNNGQPGFPRQPPPQGLPPSNPGPNNNRGPNNNTQDFAFPVRRVLNDRCTQDSECGPQGSYCKDRSHCACEEDLIASTDLKRCLHVANDIKDKCEENVQCTESLTLGAECRQGMCQCVPAYRYADIDGRKGCYKEKKIGERCLSTQECTANPDPKAVSCNQICECKPPYVPNADNTECKNGASAMGSLLALTIISIFSRILL